jgi:hypothetical protein
MTETPTTYAIVQAMHRFGGSFAKALATAFDHADPENFGRLQQAFPELWDEYIDTARVLAKQGRGPK